MVKTCTVLFSYLVATHASSPNDFPVEDFDQALNLLQMRATPKANTTVHRHSRVRDNPRNLERERCPHEIDQELAAQGDQTFGCSGELRALETVQCSFWGEPHITATFPSPRPAVPKGDDMDYLHKPGHFRLASAADGSWEIQIFNCGIYASAMAARFGKDIVEIIVNKQGALEYYVNGKPTSAGSTMGDIHFDSTHRHIKTDNYEKARRPLGMPGTCIDAPNGQIMIDFAQGKQQAGFANTNNNGNVNLHIVAAKDAVTTKDQDGSAICNEIAGGGTEGQWDAASQPVKEGESLFISTGTRVCEACSFLRYNQEEQDLAEQACQFLDIGDLEPLRLDRVCAGKNIAVADAQTACAHLVDQSDFYADCQLDYCAEGGVPEAVANAEEEEAIENPQPICFGPAECDPAAACCNALRDQAELTLDNVVQNNICGTDGGERELRFGRALTQNGQNMDLVIVPVGDHDCGSVSNNRFGSKTAEIGVLGVQAGTEATFEFKFVESGTANLVAPKSLMLSFLDLDQGKNNKQRESIEVCGGINAIMTDDSELEAVRNGDCVKVTSTTWGTGKDNPVSVEGMSQTQRARVAAFQVQGATFTAKLGVTKKGKNPRKFAFAGKPSVACVLK